MNNKIYPCIWCDNNAIEVAGFYQNTFPDTKITAQNPVVVMLEMSNQNLMLLNGGDKYQPNPAISFMYMTPDSDLIDHLWAKLSSDGFALMPKDKYDWSDNYGWVQDKYGVSWQLYFGPEEYCSQTIVPTLMFTQDMNGKAEEAAAFYRSVFPDSEERGMQKRENGEVEHGEFKILNYLLMMMDGGNAHNFSFSEGFSLVVNCKDQMEIDNYWNALTSNGGEESKCGWLKDQYGVSWQIIPENLGNLMTQNPAAGEALMKMKKIEIEKLK